ncbi:hypothetical protein JX266_014572, partial [Neoarthrinium moseri]
VKEHSKIDEWYVEASTPADELARLRQELKDAQNEIDQLKDTVEGAGTRPDPAGAARWSAGWTASTARP